MGELVASFQRLLLADRGRARDDEDLGGLLTDYEACLEELGVVPPPVRRTIRRLEGDGWGVKVSGAGALSGDAAGSLLAYHPDRGRALPSDLPAGTVALPLDLGAPGLELEVRA